MYAEFQQAGENSLHHWPSTGEVNRIPPEELLIICIANSGIDIMVVNNGPEI